MAGEGSLEETLSPHVIGWRQRRGRGAPRRPAWTCIINKVFRFER